MMPTEQAAFRTLNSGSTVPIMMSKPLPSSPSIADAGTRDAVGRDRRRVVAAQAEAVERALDANAGRLRGTSQSVLSPSPACSGCDDQTYAVALRRRRDPALCARRATTSSPFALAVLTGAQKWLRDPASLNASVLRCAPLAARLPDVAGAVRLEHRRAAVVHADHHRGRSAFLREASDDGGGAPKAEAEAADLRRADGAQQSSRGEGFQPRSGNALAIDRCGVRRDDVGADLF